MSKYKETVDAITASDALKERVMQQALHPDEIFADMRPVQYRRFAAPMMACMCLILAAAIAIPLLIINFGDFSPAWEDLPTDKVTWLVEPTHNFGNMFYYCRIDDVYYAAKSTGIERSYTFNIIDEKTFTRGAEYEGYVGDLGFSRWIYDPALNLFGRYSIIYMSYSITLYPIENALPLLGADAYALKTVGRVDSTMRVPADEDEYEFGEKLPEEAFSGYAVAYGSKFVTDFIYKNSGWGRRVDSLMGVRNQDDKHGVIDKNGNTIVPFELDLIGIIDERSAFAMYDGLWGIIAIPPVQPLKETPEYNEPPTIAEIKNESGVIMHITSVDRSKITFKFENPTDKTFTRQRTFAFEESYRLFARKNGEWELLHDDMGVRDMGFLIAPSSVTILYTCDWEELVGSLLDGEYKFNISIHDSEEEWVTYTFEYEFTIGDPDTSGDIIIWNKNGSSGLPNIAVTWEEVTEARWKQEFGIELPVRFTLHFIGETLHYVFGYSMDTSELVVGALNYSTNETDASNAHERWISTRVKRDSGDIGFNSTVQWSRINGVTAVLFDIQGENKHGIFTAQGYHVEFEARGFSEMEIIEYIRACIVGDAPPPAQSLSERLAALFRLNGSMEVEKGALDAIIEESKQKTPDITDIKNVYTENLHFLTVALSSFAPSLANINHHFPIEYIRRVDDNTIEVVLRAGDIFRSLYFENLYGGEENEDYNADTELWWFKPGATSPGD
jgi:hypothetical protein